MTKDEALKLALEALGEIEWSNNNQWQSDRAKVAITAIKEALEESENDELIIRYHEMTIKRLEKRIEELTAQPEQEPLDFACVMEAGDDRWKKLPIQERNFCQRCGKRTADLTTIHTCTPPQGNT